MKKQFIFLKINLSIVIVLMMIGFIPVNSQGAVGVVWNGSLTLEESYQAASSTNPQSNNDFKNQFNLGMDLNSGEKQSGYILLQYDFQSQDQEQDNGSFVIYQAHLDLLLNDSNLLRIGRQKISWGSGFVWNPTNYIGAAKDRSDLDAVYPGVDVINYEASWSNGGAVFTLKPQSVWKDSDKALKLNWQIDKNDIGISAYQHNSDNALGIDYATTLGDFTFYTEISSKTGNQWYIANDYKQQRSDTERFLHAVIGMNGNFENRLNIIIEYYHNQEGWDKTETAHYFQYFNSLASDGRSSLLQDKLDLLGELCRNYLFLTINKRGVAEDLSISISGLYNMDDHSLQWIPRLEYQLGQNTFFIFMMNIYTGDAQSEFGAIGNIITAKCTLNF